MFTQIRGTCVQQYCPFKYRAFSPIQEKNLNIYACYFAFFQFIKFLDFPFVFMFFNTFTLNIVQKEIFWTSYTLEVKITRSSFNPGSHRHLQENKYLTESVCWFKGVCFAFHLTHFHVHYPCHKHDILFWSVLPTQYKFWLHICLRSYCAMHNGYCTCTPEWSRSIISRRSVIYLPYSSLKQLQHKIINASLIDSLHLCCEQDSLLSQFPLAQLSTQIQYWMLFFVKFLFHE